LSLLERGHFGSGFQLGIGVGHAKIVLAMQSDHWDDMTHAGFCRACTLPGVNPSNE